MVRALERGARIRNRGAQESKRDGAQTVKILMIDNYDSFTYNLVQYLGELGAEVDRQAQRRDRRRRRARAEARRDRDLARPVHAAARPASRSPLLRELAGEIPILGVCLGHQCIGEAFGGKVVRAGRLMHGKTSPILHDGKTHLRRACRSPFDAMRYHSLLVDARLDSAIASK